MTMNEQQPIDQQKPDGVLPKAEPESRLWSPTAELRWVIAGVAIQAAVLVGMILVLMAPHVFGETVRLRVRPVDPRSLFRGDYVILSYDFTNFDPQNVVGRIPDQQDHNGSDLRGRLIYVWLERDEDRRLHRVKKLSIEPPASGKYLTGRVTGWGRRLECGIESFFVQEGTGKEIEKAVREGRAIAEVAVWNGAARVKGVTVESGQPTANDGW